MNKTKKTVIVFVLLFVVIAVGLFAAITLGKRSVPSDVSHETGTSTSQAPVTYGVAIEEHFEHFVELMKTNELLGDIPKEGTILVRFYTFTNGERLWQHKYLLTKNTVGETDKTTADLLLSIHSKYLTALDKDNFCWIVQQAKRNGDFGSEATLSTTKLLWKYKSMLSYKDCLGL